MARKVEWQVSPDDRGVRLDAALAQRVEDFSRADAQRAIRDGLVRIDGQTETRPSTKLRSGATVEALLPDAEPQPAGAIPADVPVNIVFQDESLVVVDKAAGIAVHPGPGHDRDTLVNGLLQLFPEMAGIGDPNRPGVIHRLDLDTSGLLIFALTQDTFKALGAAMRERRIKRTYTALVHGRVHPAQGTVDAPIGRDPSNRMRQAIVESGRQARTHYRTVEPLKNSTLLEVDLETGRMHQIRVHMAAIGFPVLGDATYGRSPAIPGLERQFLHASRLSFVHPVSGKEITVESPLPPDLQAVLDHIRNK